MADATGRVFLFLQGPHGPFFRRLAGALGGSGAAVRRVAFNRGDAAEWGGAGPLDAFTWNLGSYRAWLDALARRRGVTDLVLYGEARPVHGIALGLARERGIRTHCLEEGYLRPHWITYERQGTNARSPLCRIPLEHMGAPEDAPAPAPARWGDARQHLWWSACYHARLLLPAGRFRACPGHRDQPPWQEAAHYLRRGAGLPWRRLASRARRDRLLRSGARFHLVLLQLSFDCSLRAHSRFGSNAEFAAEVLEGFAAGAPAGDRLVFRAHPFEDGRERLERRVARHAARLGLAGRVDFLDGGAGLDALLDGARSVLTVNSTAGHQALARGLPLFAAGQGVYARPGLVASGDAARFFARPPVPDRQGYALLRAFMLRSSQIAGSFYSARGIERALARLPGLMLDPSDPYDAALAAGGGAARAQVRTA